MNPYYMGIDGGGSHLRIAVVDSNMAIITTAAHETANPNLIGHDEAARRIQEAIMNAMRPIKNGDLVAVGIGIAGASAAHSEVWLRETVLRVLPDTQTFPSSDHEIALVGALGKQAGILLLAGTGSVAFGINPTGKRRQLGGWGYLLGDEGSGAWLGLQALRVITHQYDARQYSEFSATILKTLEIDHARRLISLIYHPDKPPIRKLARLAPIILTLAEAGDPEAKKIIQNAADALVGLAENAKNQLDLPEAEIAFAGGLLTSDNILSQQVAIRLGLPDVPVAKYPPVVGAALLAKLMLAQ